MNVKLILWSVDIVLAILVISCNPWSKEQISKSSLGRMAALDVLQVPIPTLQPSSSTQSIGKAPRWFFWYSLQIFACFEMFRGIFPSSTAWFLVFSVRDYKDSNEMMWCKSCNTTEKQDLWNERFACQFAVYSLMIYQLPFHYIDRRFWKLFGWKGSNLVLLHAVGKHTENWCGIANSIATFGV